jgi:hypothetical protein
MSTKAQKDRILQLSSKDKKLMRLLTLENMTKADHFTVNYAY